ncbi:TrkA family potassium uptake protein [Neobacillus cucumis]|uniref:TrkA family potassium uptake protein n=1 Tax=Bacillus salipaludis TaxID=2547811 RepID=A0A4R5VKZ3_9BACI|nr:MULTISPECIES: TrkA family potassium uptake protein [Bacillaceae]MBI0579677.1 TrkA family potassium uptake protein [Neobacillus cucumis]MDQ6596587.1 TrkA family potassium uptake protein [Bacillus salipaludis]MED1472043.1 TrkA family potassium uptake protein [Bacillus salipaludis]TDK58499.1 TrkA family potassium uptake protein [Bacillus salipaludis]WHY94620.1 TrkA family potassium uptake protein [Neobacillus cucumis]
MQKQYAVIGMGRFGSSVAAALFKEGNEVLAIDKKEENIEDNQDSVTHAVIGDTTDVSTLKNVGIRNFDTVIVAIGDDLQASILSVLLLKELGVKHVVAKAINKSHGQVLDKVGADRVIYPEKDMGERLAHQLMSSPNVLNFIELADDYSIEEIKVPASMNGQNLREINMRANYNITVIGIKNKNKIDILPNPETPLKSDDILIVIGENEDLQKFSHIS